MHNRGYPLVLSLVVVVGTRFHEGCQDYSCFHPAAVVRVPCILSTSRCQDYSCFHEAVSGLLVLPRGGVRTTRVSILQPWQGGPLWLTMRSRRFWQVHGEGHSPTSGTLRGHRHGRTEVVPGAAQPLSVVPSAAAAGCLRAAFGQNRPQARDFLSCLVYCFPH